MWMHGRPQKKMQGGNVILNQRLIASEPCSRVLHGQFSKITASLTMHDLEFNNEPVHTI